MRFISRLSVVAACISSQACYSLQPTGGVLPLVGSSVAFDINDAGRVALGGQMTPEIAQIEGRLISQDSTDYLVAVSAVRSLRGGEQVWAGEQVHIKPAYVSVVYERNLSRSKTILASAAGIGLAAFLASRAIATTYSPPDPTKLPSDTALSILIPRP